MIRSRTARSSGPGGNKAPFRQDVFQSSIMLYATKEPGAVASMSLRFIISNLYINIVSMPYESPSAANYRPSFTETKRQERHVKDLQTSQ